MGICHAQHHPLIQKPDHNNATFGAKGKLAFKLEFTALEEFKAASAAHALEQVNQEVKQAKEKKHGGHGLEVPAPAELLGLSIGKK